MLPSFHSNVIVKNQIMKIKNIQTLLAAGCLCCGMAFLSACADWDDHYGTNEASQGATVTLWQQLQDNPQLSDFCEVLQQTKVFRMHKKTPVSYADLLDAGQSFTVVAPVNGTFNKDSLLKLVQTAQGDSVVEKNFVQNHVSRTLTSIKPESTRLRLLNRKNAPIAEGAIAGVNITAPNLHAKNGILHIASSQLPYERSIYETLCDNPEVMNIGKLLRQYEDDYFDADASVSSGIVEGLPVYVDSVVVGYNKLLSAIDYFDEEDSTFWMVAPTNEGWKKAWNEAASHFVYDASELKRDSLQQYWTMRSLLVVSVFNMTDQLTTTDSLVSVFYKRQVRSASSTKPIFYVFKKPFEKGGILDGAKAVQCSNGILYETPEWPFTPGEAYFTERWTECENTSLILQEKDCSYNSRRVVSDSVSEGGYLQILPRTATSNWSLTFRLNGVPAGDYDICAVILPRTVADPTLTGMKPCKFRAELNYFDVDGTQQSYDFERTQFQSNPERVDTIVLAERYHIPTSNLGLDQIKTTLKLQCSIVARETARFSREMYLDCIYLRPRSSKTEE
jgi:hypothetical protein